MSLIPAFELGIWNVWIPMLYLPLHPLIMIVADKIVGVGNITRKMGKVPYNKTENITFILSMVVYALMLIYSIFLPLKLWTIWFYAGALIYLAGLTIFIIAIVNIAVTTHGEPFIRGVYRYSRHPMTIVGTIMHLGMSIASASWVFLLLSIVSAILSFVLVIPEERGCLEYYGDTYRKYLNGTPRWMGVPKSG